MTFASTGTNTATVTAYHNDEGGLFIYPLPLGITLTPEDAIRFANYILESQPVYNALTATDV